MKKAAEQDASWNTHYCRILQWNMQAHLQLICQSNPDLASVGMSPYVVSWAMSPSRSGGLPVHKDELILLKQAEVEPLLNSRLIIK
jgi:hypothetical protein